MNKVSSFFKELFRENELDEIDWENLNCVVCDEYFEDYFIFDCKDFNGGMTEAYNYANICEGCMKKLKEAKKLSKIKHDALVSEGEQ